MIYKELNEEIDKKRIENMSLFIEQIQSDEELRNLMTLAKFEILKKYAELELTPVMGTQKKEIENSEEFRKEIKKYCLIINSIKNVYEKRKIL